MAPPTSLEQVNGLAAMTIASNGPAQTDILRPTDDPYSSPTERKKEQAAETATDILCPTDDLLSALTQSTAVAPTTDPFDDDGAAVATAAAAAAAAADPFQGIFAVIEPSALILSPVSVRPTHSNGRKSWTAHQPPKSPIARNNHSPITARGGHSPRQFASLPACQPQSSASSAALSLAAIPTTADGTSWRRRGFVTGALSTANASALSPRRFPSSAYDFAANSWPVASPERTAANHDVPWAQMGGGNDATHCAPSMPQTSPRPHTTSSSSSSIRSSSRSLSSSNITLSVPRTSPLSPLGAAARVCLSPLGQHAARPTMVVYQRDRSDNRSFGEIDGNLFDCQGGGAQSSEGWAAQGSIDGSVHRSRTVPNGLPATVCPGSTASGGGAYLPSYSPCLSPLSRLRNLETSQRSYSPSSSPPGLSPLSQGRFTLVHQRHHRRHSMGEIDGAIFEANYSVGDADEKERGDAGAVGTVQAADHHCGAARAVTPPPQLLLPGNEQHTFGRSRSAQAAGAGLPGTGASAHALRRGGISSGGGSGNGHARRSPGVVLSRGGATGGGAVGKSGSFAVPKQMHKRSTSYCSTATAAGADTFWAPVATTAAAVAVGGSPLRSPLWMERPRAHRRSTSACPDAMEASAASDATSAAAAAVSSPRWVGQRTTEGMGSRSFVWLPKVVVKAQDLHQMHAQEKESGSPEGVVTLQAQGSGSSRICSGWRGKRMDQQRHHWGSVSEIDGYLFEGTGEAGDCGGKVVLTSVQLPRQRASLSAAYVL